jgi:site-specific recombinase XerD
MKDLLASFRTFLEVQRNVSKHTCRAYLADIAEYNEFLQSRENISAQKTIPDAQMETCL